MINSVGFAIIYKDKILLARPKRQGGKSWGIAKGKIETGETFIQTAIRETREEIGITIPEYLVPVEPVWSTIVYKNAKEKSYKKLHYSILRINELSDIGMETENIEKDNLSEIEIEEARFMTYDEAVEKIFWRQKEILDILNEKVYGL